MTQGDVERIAIYKGWVGGRDRSYTKVNMESQEDEDVEEDTGQSSK